MKKGVDVIRHDNPCVEHDAVEVRELTQLIGDDVADRRVRHDAIVNGPESMASLRRHERHEKPAMPVVDVGSAWVST